MPPLLCCNTELWAQMVWNVFLFVIFMSYVGLFGHAHFPLTRPWLFCSWEWSQVHLFTLVLMKLSVSHTITDTLNLNLFMRLFSCGE